MKRKAYLMASSCLLVLGLSACANVDNPRVSELENQLQEANTQVVDTNMKNASLESEINALKQQGQTANYVRSDEPMLPPQAKAGECYARVFVPPTYETLTERLLKTEASERVEVIPASYAWGEEKVVVSEASERIEVIPATYKTVQERVMVTPQGERLETVPAVHESVSEKILVKPAYTTWKKGRGPIEKLDEATGEIMCLVEVPAEYRTVTKRVLKTPAQTRTIKIPAAYKTVTRTIVDQPASTRAVKIPAQYGSVKVQKLVQPAKERRIAIPAEYQTVSKTNQTTEGRMEWRPILCETNVTPDIVSRLQRALLAKGHNPGPIDNVLGTDTMAAVSAFQRAQGLPTGQLTIETLKALNVSLRG